MTTRQPSSRLEMMQARFQQKQLQEKEQKLLQLYDQQQQRAYQVVQRGSAGSNGSNGSNVNHQTISRTSTTSYSTSNTQGGKVRQMFDERRQTTKGIDRSYPLEPLDNKLTKQLSSSNGTQETKNGNQTRNRQFVSVRTVTRSDVNSNVNGGKPVVSYHEDITRQTYSLPDHDRRSTGERENGNYNDSREEVQVDEVFDDDVIQRNRMMAKIHLMNYDENMKHRIRNDLESEQFPEDLMIDVPDKLPKKTLTKKLTQAEARLARFKNVNAKKDNILKNGTTTRKVKEQTTPVRSTVRTNKSPSPDSPQKKSFETNIRTTVRKSTTTTASNSPSKNSDIVSRDSRTSWKSTTSKAGDVDERETSSINNRYVDSVDGGESRNNYSTEEYSSKTTFEDEARSTTPLDERIQSKENEAELLRKSSGKKQTSERPTSQPNSSVSSVVSPNSMQRSSAKDKMATKVKSGARSAKIPSTPTKSPKTGGNTGNPVDNLVSCKICDRRFAQDRITLHEQICSKASQKKRKQFDAMLFRVKGTDLEPFVKKGTAKKQAEKKAKKPEVKSNWRRKHEDFINAIRSAKQMQMHLAAGGKLSDLPPPPPSDTSDYIQCPHCGRKFNQGAAERHIPKCQNMLHNKPSHARAPLRSKR